MTLYLPASKVPTPIVFSGWTAAMEEARGVGPRCETYALSRCRQSVVSFWPRIPSASLRVESLSTRRLDGDDSQGNLGGCAEHPSRLERRARRG